MLDYHLDWICAIQTLFKLCIEIEYIGNGKYTTKLKNLRWYELINLVYYDKNLLIEDITFKLLRKDGFYFHERTWHSTKLGHP